MITLTHGNTTLALSDRLVWSDEFDWAPVEQSTQRTLTGALVLSVAARLAGRPITLQGGESAAWLTRGTCATLRAWCAEPGLELVLLLRGQNWNVIFDHQRGALEAKPIWALLDGQEHAEQLFIPTLRFLTV
jgi:hypothetical protein